MTTQDAPAEPVTDAPNPEADGAKPGEPLGAPGIAALKSEREAKAAAEKRAAAAEARLKEIEDQGKTEAQKQAERLAEIERENAGLKSAKARAEVAAAKGIPATIIAGPASDTADDLEAYAQELLAWKGTQAPQGTYTVPVSGQRPELALNGDGIESALKSALGIR